MLKQIYIPALFLGATLTIFSCGNQTVSASKKPIQKDVNLPEQEEELIGIYEKLMESKQGDFDSLDYFSHLFSAKLEELVSTNPKTLEYSFSQLVDTYTCNVETSEDGLFRIYTWDSQLGGTMRFFNVIYQYKNGKTVKTQRYVSTFEGDPIWFCSEIFTLKAEKRTYYLGITNGIGSTKDVSQSIKAFELTDKGVNDSVALFQSEEGLANSLRVSYDFFSVVDRPERPVSVIKYNSAKQLITLSETNEKDEIIAATKTYVFNGTYFEEQTLDANKK